MKTLFRIPLFIAGALCSLALSFPSVVRAGDTIPAALDATDQLYVKGLIASVDTHAGWGYKENNVGVVNSSDIGVIGNIGAATSNRSGNVIIGFRLPTLTGPISEVAFSVAKTGNSGSHAWGVQLYAFAPDKNPRTLANANGPASVYYENAGTDTNANVRLINNNIMVRTTANGTVSIDLTALFGPSGSLNDFYDAAGNPVLENGMIWFRLNPNGEITASGQRIVVDNNTGGATSPSLVFKTRAPGASELPYPHAWEAADAADARVAAAHQGHLTLLNREIDRHRETQSQIITDALANGAGVPAATLHHAYALAYRASLAKSATPLTTWQQAAYDGFVASARDALLAATNALSSAAPGVAGAQVAALADAQGSLARIYRILVDLEVIAPADRPALATKLGNAADAILALSVPAAAASQSAALAEGLSTTAGLAELSADSRRTNWLAYADSVWNAWTLLNDTTEDARGVNARWLHAMLLQADAMGASYIAQLSATAAQTSLGRFAHLAAPNGALPDFGDTFWDEGLGRWLHAFEKLGQLYQRADFLDNAAKLAAYIASEPDMVLADMDGLVAATRAVAAVSAPAPDIRPTAVVTTRTVAPGGEPVFDKLHLGTGRAATDTFAAFDLYNQGEAGHEDAGALSLYTSGSSVLLHSLGAGPDNIRPNRQHGVWAMPTADASGFLTVTTSPGAGASTTTDAYAEEDPVAPKGGLTRAMVDSSGRQITHYRDIRVRAADGALFVLDTFRFAEAGDYTVGPVWHAETITAQGASHVITRDNVQIDSDGSKAASVPASVRFDFAVAGTETFTLANATDPVGRHPQIQHFAATVAGTRAVGDTVSILTVLRKDAGSLAAPTSVAVLDRYADYIDATGRLIVGINPFPTITAFSPAELTVGGTLTITGENLDKVDHVFFESVEAAAGTWTLNSPSQITATVPAGIPDTGYIIVTSDNPLINSGTSAAPFTIAVAPGGLAPPADQSLIVGDDFVLTAAATAGNPAPTWQWQVSTDGGNVWTDIDGATDATLTVQDVTYDMNGWQYRYAATNFISTTYSNPATLTVARVWYDTRPAAFTANDQVNVPGAGNPSAPTFLGYHKNSEGLTGVELGLVGNSGGANARHNGNVIMGFALPTLTGPLDTVSFTVTQREGTSALPWWAQLYAFAPNTNPRDVADTAPGAYATLHFASSGTDANPNVILISGSLMSRSGGAGLPSATVTIDLTQHFESGGLLAGFYDANGNPISEDGMIWFRLNQGGAMEENTNRIVVQNTIGDPNSPSLVFKTKHVPSSADLPYPASWIADDNADARVAAAHQSYLALFNRQIDSQRATQLPPIADALANGDPVSAATIHYAYALAYRASLAKGDSQLIDMALDTHNDFIINARNALIAATNAATSANPAVADAQTAELLTAQGSLVRLYTLLADSAGLDALNPAERAALEPKLAAAAQAVLAAAPAAAPTGAATAAADGLAVTATLLPADPAAPAWLAYGGDVWAATAQLADTTEDARAANGLWLHSMLLNANVAAQLAAPAIQDALDRYAHMLAPNGTLPDYGITHWDEGLGHWLHAYEKLGQLHARADFLANAASLSAYLKAKTSLIITDIDGLVAACRAVAAVTPDAGATPNIIITTRVETSGSLAYDKLHIRTGNTAADSFASFDLYNQGGLGHENAGALTLYTSGSNVLLHSLGGANTQPNRQQNAWAAPATDAASFLTITTSPGAAAVSTTNAYTEENIEAPKAGLTRAMRDSSGRAITHHRDIRLRLADNALFVLDTFEFATAGDYTVGPVWHAQTIAETGATHIIARDDVQINSDGSKAANATPVPVRFDFAVSDTATGYVIVSDTYAVGRHPQLNHFAATTTAPRAAGEIVSILSVLRSGTPAAPIEVSMTERYARYTDATSTLVVGMNPFPSISAFTPREVTIGGTVTITGENLDKADALYFADILAPAGTWSKTGSTVINVTVPAGIPADGYIKVSSTLFPLNPSVSVTPYTIAAAPDVLAILEDQNATAGKSLTFEATVTGNPAPVIQWQVSKDGGVTWEIIDGATAATLTVSNVTTAMTGWQYRYTATNHAGSQTSNAATLAVKTAWFNEPSAIAIDAAGNHYIADAATHAIYTAAPDGSIKVFAGVPGTVGTATGTSTRMNAPAGLSIAPGKNLRFTDQTQRVRIVHEDGSSEVFVGRVNNADGILDGYTTTARFMNPVAIVTDSHGNSYVADSANHAIRRVSTDTALGGNVTTIAGNGASGTANGSGTAARFNTPTGLALDETAQVLYVADTGNHVIRVIDLASASHPVTLYAGAFGQSGAADGALLDARFNAPRGIARDGENLYIVDTGNSTIREISGTQVHTIAGAPGKHGMIDGAGTAARFNHPRELALDASGNIYVADTGNGAIRKIAADDTVSSVTYYNPAPPPPTNGGMGGGGSGGGGGALSPWFFLAIIMLHIARRRK